MLLLASLCADNRSFSEHIYVFAPIQHLRSLPYIYICPFQHFSFYFIYIFKGRYFANYDWWHYTALQSTGSIPWHKKTAKYPGSSLAISTIYSMA